MNGTAIDVSAFIEARATLVHYLVGALEPPGVGFGDHRAGIPRIAQACSTLDRYYAGLSAEGNAQSTRLMDFYRLATCKNARVQDEAGYKPYQPRWAYRLAWDQLAELFGFVDTLAAEAVRIDRSGDRERALRVCAFQTVLELGGTQKAA